MRLDGNILTYRYGREDSPRGFYNVSVEVLDVNVLECLVWIDALRSKEFEQGQNKLSKKVGETTYYCCLGVAEKVCSLNRANDMFLTDEDFSKLISVSRGDIQLGFSHLNDAGMSFDFIAECLEQIVTEWEANH